tara:strand:+ start:1640 stop:1753 length:114 start_codon:yes stop_codon:yes gene_type:complete
MAAKKGGILGMAIGLAVLGVTIYVVGYSWKKGTEMGA